MITFSQYKQALRNQTRTPIFKIEFMNSNELVIDEVITDMLSGSIAIELKNGVRRTCNLELCNSTGKYIPDPDGLIYIGNKCKVHTGLQIGGENYFNSQGIFNFCNPILKSTSSSNIFNIEGIDNFSLLNGNPYGKLTDTYVIPAGTLITSAVASIFTLAGIIKSPIIYNSNEITPYTITKNAGETYESLLLELADILSWACYIDTEGHPRFEPNVNEIASYQDWEYTTDEVTYLGSTHEYKLLDVRNSIKVIGNNINGKTSVGTAQDTNIFSPTNINKIGAIWEVIEDTNIYSDALALERATYELKQRIQLYESIDISSIPVDFLDVGNIVVINDIKNGCNRSNFLIKQINRNLNFNTTDTLNIWKTREVT